MTDIDIMKKPWIVVLRPSPYRRPYPVRTFRSEARAARYASRKNKWNLEGVYRAIHYTVWNDYLNGKEDIA